jgi:hypothetical protein
MDAQVHNIIDLAHKLQTKVPPDDQGRIQILVNKAEMGGLMDYLSAMSLRPLETKGATCTSLFGISVIEK